MFRLMLKVLVILRCDNPALRNWSVLLICNIVSVLLAIASVKKTESYACKSGGSLYAGMAVKKITKVLKVAHFTPE